MNAQRWQEIEAVLQGALDLPPLERGRFLEDACAGDEELKEEANSLIAAYDEAGDFIEQPAIAHDARVLLGADSIGREIGPYRIIERLGAGGMSEVYLAQDTRLSRLVALKLLPAYFAADDARLRRFQSEARAASALNHPNILTIHEVGEHDGVYFIATEFIDGQTIRELIRNNELSVGDILDSVEQMASALSTAHAAGIVHRDIKPENIMRRSDGLLKILDFGIAKLIELETNGYLNETTGLGIHTEVGLVVGTVNYMSPEQARGLPVDERTDIWSLGVVLYEMLTGRLPFSGATRMDTMVAILDREPAPLSQVANEHYLSAPLLQSIIDKCLRKEMNDRYRTVSELLSDLRSVREQLNRPSPRKSSPVYVWPIIGVVVLLIVAIAGATLYRRLVRQPDPPAASEATARPTKLYLQMSERERLDFVAAQEHRISAMMSDRPAKLSEDAVRVIKTYVDRYAAKMSVPADQGNMSLVYARAQPYLPLIARSFAARKVPIIIGIYLPVIESAYRSCFESSLGAKGLFQLMPQTAEGYGVARQDMCDEEKMTPAAAHYIADRMAELGEDSESLTLVLLSYNRGPDWVRDTLRQLRGTKNYERNFWTLLANREALDDFNRESAGYVPMFFAVAIIGENPDTFGLQMPPLSTLANANASK
jgi:serine/threonine protein kinase/septum formation topological specificity factor MinE